MTGAADMAAPERDAGREAIIVTGGLPPGDGEDGHPYTAEAGAARWTRGAGEPFEAFRRRVLADPIAATTGFVVFGGLPDGSEADARL